MAEQSAKLDALSEKWKKRRLQAETQLDGKNAPVFGWARSAELWNSRFAMFFFATGLATEYYTGQSNPDQIGTLLDILG